MAEMIVLEGGSGDLLEIEEQPGINWYSVTLVQRENRVRLGAENRTYIARRLTAALRGEGVVAGKLEDVDVKWALSLAEQHFTLYVHDSGNIKQFWWQAPDAQSFYRMTLTASDSVVWLARLAAWEEPDATITASGVA